MALLTPLPTLRLTQPFNGADPREPKLWFQNWHGQPMAAYDSNFPGAQGVALHYHGGLDYGVKANTPLRAMERGKVVGVYTAPNGAKVIKVRINPKAVYSFWHINAASAKLGEVVSKGQIIALSGATGATAAHLHLGLRIKQLDPDGVTRDYLFDASLFYEGKALANSKAILPIY